MLMFFASEILDRLTGARSALICSLLAAALAAGPVPGTNAGLRADEGLPSADTLSGSGGSQSAGKTSLEGASEHVRDMCTLDQEIADYNAEIANQRRAIADMQRVLDASRKPGGAVPDINRLKGQGIAGKGVVGAGKSKPQVIQDAIAEYESKANPQNYLGILRLSNNITRERNRLKAERRRALGLGEDDELPKHELDAIEKMAGGRAYYANEIARSKEFIARLQAKIRERNSNRMNIRSAMSDDEFEAYKRQRAGQSVCGSQSSASAGTQTGSSSAGGGSGAGGESTSTSTSPGGPCPPVPGWDLPADARCARTAGSATPSGPGH